MTAVLTLAQRKRRHTENIAAGLTITCKRVGCGFAYRKGWGTEDGFCCQTCRNLSSSEKRQ